MISWITDVIAAGGIWGIFALMLLENLFPPIPSELIMPMAGFAVARGQMSMAGVLLAGLLGTIAGNAVWFEAARWFGAARSKALVARFGGWLGITHADMDNAELTLRRHGPWAVLIGRLMPGIRTVISIPAGLIEMPRGLFYGLTALGSAVWIGLLTVTGYVLEDRFGVVETWLDPVGKVIVVVVAALMLWTLWALWRRR
ncbi:MAG: DedA family protein [Alphaproteobacteria bacterium]|nr:DedA family protein [Alphaproteobacteria bacterium]